MNTYRHLRTTDRMLKYIQLQKGRRQSEVTVNEREQLILKVKLTAQPIKDTVDRGITRSISQSMRYKWKPWLLKVSNVFESVPSFLRENTNSYVITMA